MTNDARPALRAGDADRERTIDALGAHAAAGRLTVDELDERTDAAYAARTLDDLDALLADLPELDASPPATAPQASAASPYEEELRSDLRSHLVIYLLVNLMLIGIWAATGFGYFWPVFPILGWGVGVGMHAFSTREDIRRVRIAAPEQQAQIVAKAKRRHRAHIGHGHGR